MLHDANKYLLFVGTSDGTRKGILNRRGGLCKDRNMKIRIRVLPRGDANDPRLGYSVTVSGTNRFRHEYFFII